MITEIVRWFGQGLLAGVWFMGALVGVGFCGLMIASIGAFIGMIVRGLDKEED